jgi:hypothetical protein
MKHTIFLSAALALLAACSQQPDADLQSMTAAVNAYLAKKGDLCLGKDKWPIDVMPREAGAHARNAVQMPVLEHIGLVSSSQVKVEATEETPATTVTRYALTDEGRKYFLVREASHGDFCAARLTLDKIVGWEVHKGDKDQAEALVTYTYKIDAAPWTRDADVQKAFPMVDRVVRGAGAMELKESFQRTGSGWVAKDA